MEKQRFWITFFLIFIVLNSVLFAKEKEEVFTKEELTWIKNNPQVSIAMLNNFSPFSYVANDKHEGFTHEIVKRIENISGLKFDYKLSRWSKALNSFKSGKVDMIADISFTKERENFTLYTPSYYEIPTYIFGLKSDKSYIKKNSLKGKTIAVSKDLFYVDFLRKQGLIILEFDSSLEKAKAVVTGKADYFISSYTTGVKVITNNTFTTLTPIDELQEIKKEDLRFGINIKKPILQSIIKKSLNEISATEIKFLSDKWILNSPENKHVINLSKSELDYITNNPIVKYSEVNWKPLSIIEDNKMKGIMGDYLELVSKRTGLVFEYVPAKTWSEVLQQFKDKKIDLVPGVGSSPQERKLGLISNMYAKYPLVIVTSSKYTYIDGVSDLSKKTIAVPKDYTSYNFIAKNFPEIKLLVTENIKEALLLVEKGKADAFVGHIATSLYYISELHLTDLKITGSTQFDFEHHYLIQQDNPTLLSIINKTFNSITYQERKDIYSRWIQTTIVEKKSNKKTIITILIVFSIIIFAFLYRHSLLKKYNQKLKDSNSEVETILNSTLEAIVISENGYCIDLNNSALNMFKIENKDDAIGKVLFDYIANDSIDIIKQKMKEDTTEPYELECIRFDGTIFSALIKGTNLKTNNRVIRLTSIIDISEIKEKERLLIEQSKMAAIGEMIGNIAHQWRQPLSVITTISSGWGIYEEFGTLDKKRVLDESKIILNHANYLSQTIDDFRQFIKGDDTTSTFTMEQLVENLLRLINPSLKSSQVDFEKSVLSKKEINGNSNELLQALINIINNSIDAIKHNNIENGKIFFDVLEDSNYLIIKIKDNGGGIDNLSIDKIFEPYFTTKHKFNGTGLGLYMTYNILGKFKGTVKAKNIEFLINNKQSKGVEFTMTIPIIKNS